MYLLAFAALVTLFRAASKSFGTAFPLSAAAFKFFFSFNGFHASRAFELLFSLLFGHALIALSVGKCG